MNKFCLNNFIRSASLRPVVKKQPSNLKLREKIIDENEVTMKFVMDQWKKTHTKKNMEEFITKVK